MSEENSHMHSTRFVHIKNAADNIQQYIDDYFNERISEEDFDAKVTEALPHMRDVGCEISDDEDAVTVNTKEVPKNAEAVMYLYMDEDDNLQLTLRFPRFDDNTQFTEENMEMASLAEAAGIDVIRLINSEHHEIIKGAMLQRLLGGLGSGEDSEGGDGEPDLLDGIEDEAVRNQVKSFMRH